MNVRRYLSLDSSNTVSVVIVYVAQAMLLAVQHLVLSATMFCFHLDTILLVHRWRHDFSGLQHPGRGGDDDWVPAC